MMLKVENNGFYGPEQWLPSVTTPNPDCTLQLPLFTYITDTMALQSLGGASQRDTNVRRDQTHQYKQTPNEGKGLYRAAGRFSGRGWRVVKGRWSGVGKYWSVGHYGRGTDGPGIGCH